jgi:hypothetical protein
MDGAHNASAAEERELAAILSPRLGDSVADDDQQFATGECESPLAECFPCKQSSQAQNWSGGFEMAMVARALEEQRGLVTGRCEAKLSLACVSHRNEETSKWNRLAKNAARKKIVDCAQAICQWCAAQKN